MTCNALRLITSLPVPPHGPRERFTWTATKSENPKNKGFSSTAHPDCTHPKENGAIEPLHWPTALALNVSTRVFQRPIAVVFGEAVFLDGFDVVSMENTERPASKYSAFSVAIR